MGAAFFCQIAALDTSQTLQNSTAYIQSWIQHLQNNPKWVLKASKQAREAVEYVMTGKLPEGRGVQQLRLETFPFIFVAVQDLALIVSDPAEVQGS